MDGIIEKGVLLRLFAMLANQNAFFEVFLRHGGEKTARKTLPPGRNEFETRVKVARKLLFFVGKMAPRKGRQANQSSTQHEQGTSGSCGMPFGDMRECGGQK
jgi:hypothetical protein